MRDELNARQEMRSLTRDHIERALKRLEAGEQGAFAESTKYDVLVGGKRYAPKRVVGLALEELTGDQFTPYDFKGGELSSSFRALQRLGYELVDKQGNVMPDPSSSTRRVLKYGQTAWQHALDAVHHLGGSATRGQITARLREVIADFNEANVEPDLSLLSVNSFSRGNYGPNKRPRRTDEGNPYDALYIDRTGPEPDFVLYQPSVHGVWELVGPGPLLRPRLVQDGEIGATTYALVLAENEATAGEFNWVDVTGVTYQFPNGYRNKVRPGMPFVYYSGTRNGQGGRKAAFYFGSGFIGDVYPDPATAALPKSNWKWVAEIVDYVPFPFDVPLRGQDGNLFELGTPAAPARNYWGVGVRGLVRERFEAIMLAAAQPGGTTPAPSSSPVVTFSEAAGLLLTRQPRTETDRTNRKTFSVRRSGQAKVTGDAAEKLFFDHLRSSEPDAKRREQIVWVAQDGETPGFDIEDRRDESNSIAYEVKGTVGGAFLNFELTENEMRAAQALGERYVIVLVTGCLGSTPCFEKVVHPAALFAAGGLEAVPSVFRIERRS